MNLHDEIVKVILPRLAEKMIQEGLISNYDSRHEPIQIVKEFREIDIRPDLVLALSNGNRILVEVANMTSPKRFIGELIYPELLLYYKRIAGALIFILGLDKQKRLGRSNTQTIALHEVFCMPEGVVTVGWVNEDNAYEWMKYIIRRYL